VTVQCVSAVVISPRGREFARVSESMSRTGRVDTWLSLRAVSSFLAMACRRFLELHPAVGDAVRLSRTVSLRGVIQGAVAATGYYVGFDGIARRWPSRQKDSEAQTCRACWLATVLIIGAAITAKLLRFNTRCSRNHADELAGRRLAGRHIRALRSAGIGWRSSLDVLIVPATLFPRQVTLL